MMEIREGQVCRVRDGNHMNFTGIKGRRPEVAKTLSSIQHGWACGERARWGPKRATVREKEECRLST